MRFLGWLTIVIYAAAFLYGAIQLLIWIGFAFSSYTQSARDYFYETVFLMMTSPTAGLPFFFGIVGVVLGVKLIRNNS